MAIAYGLVVMVLTTVVVSSQQCYSKNENVGDKATTAVEVARILKCNNQLAVTTQSNSTSTGYVSIGNTGSAL